MHREEDAEEQVRALCDNPIASLISKPIINSSLCRLQSMAEEELPTPLVAQAYQWCGTLRKPNPFNKEVAVVAKQSEMSS